MHGPNLCNLTLLGFVKCLFCVFFPEEPSRQLCTSGVRTSMDSPTSPELILESPTDLRMSQQSTIHGQRRHTDAGELLLHLSCFISAFSLVACLDWNLIELLIVKQKVKKFQQNSFEERSTSYGKLEPKILQLSEMLEEFLYCTYLRQASEQRLLAELARMCDEQSCEPQARILPKTAFIADITSSKNGLFKFISCVQQPGKDDVSTYERYECVFLTCIRSVAHAVGAATGSGN